MELSKAYSEIHRLWKETKAQRKTFENVANKVESEMSVVCQILRCFSRPIEYKFHGGYRYIVDNLSPLGEKNVYFQSNSKESKRLIEMTKQELETLVNLYSPEELEIKEIYVNELINSATVTVKLKEFQI